MRYKSVIRLCAAAAAFSLAFTSPVKALDSITVHLSGGNDDLRKELKSASLTVAAHKEGRNDSRDILSAALADYARLLDTLYANGYYSGVIRILADGREVAGMPLLPVPRSIGEVRIEVAPGTPFRFSAAQVGPLADGTDLPEGFAPGKRARSTAVRGAVETAISGWRAAGHAKAQTAAQSLLADHARAQLSAKVQIDPGPLVRFGDLRQTTPSAVRASRIQRIAGLPTGEVFSPDTLDTVATRLRRTGAFSSVSFTESETLGADNSMDIGLALADQKPRRYGFGAELSSMEGVNLSTFWMHRNLFNGAERFRLEGDVSNIGTTEGGIDYGASARIDIPAVLGPDTKVFALTRLEHLDEPDYKADSLRIGGGATWYLSDRLEAEAAAFYWYSETDDDFGKRTFQMLTFPGALTLDARDDPLDPINGYFVNLQASPFVGMDNTATGLRSYADGRVYRGIGAADKLVLAGRLQFGAVTGARVGEVHPDFLFFSGGGGTVRGQPYQSLNVTQGGNETGGRSFIGLSLEARAAVWNNLGAVAFVDAGYIGSESFYDGSGNWHSGAGLGLRYKTGIGPIRFDVAAPVSGNTGDGVQFYLGIGQAF